MIRDFRQISYQVDASKAKKSDPLWPERGEWGQITRCSMSCNHYEKIKKLVDYKKRRRSEYLRWCKFNLKKFKQ